MADCSADRQALKALCQERGTLFGLICRFNLLPAVYIHPTWVADEVDYCLFFRLAQSQRGMVKLSQWILDKHQLSHDAHLDFGDPLFRLALLPPEMMLSFTLYCGIALNHSSIIAVIDRDERQDIITSIGMDGYHFAVKSAPLLMGENETFAASHHSRVDRKTYYQHCGAAYLLSSFTHAPRALLQRLCFKFPKDINQQQHLFLINQSVRYRWPFLKRIFLHVIDPKWNHLYL